MDTKLCTYCIIPHEARATDFFEAVFDDGLLLRQQQCTGPLFFSHVLSPAHGAAQHVVDPLLKRFSAGGKGALVLVFPEDDDESGCGSKIIRGGVTATGEKLEVAMDLLTHLLSSIFDTPQPPSHVLVSAASFTIKGTKARDLLGQVDVYHWEDTQRFLVQRDGTSADWGVFVGHMNDRHTQLIRGSLQRESVLLLRVEREGGGSLMVVEMGCDSGTLLQLSLLLRNGGAGGSLAFQSSDFFASALRDFTPPVALMHFVGIPDPVPAPLGTMRLLRFMSVMFSAASDGSRRQLRKGQPDRRGLQSFQKNAPMRCKLSHKCATIENLGHRLLGRSQPLEGKESTSTYPCLTVVRPSDEYKSSFHRRPQQMMTVFASSDGVNYTVVEPTAASTLPQSKGRDQSDSASSGKTPFSKDSTRNSRSTASSTAMQRTGAANSHGASARTTSGLLLQNEDAAKDPTVAADLSVAYSGVEIMKQTVSKLALRVEQLEEGQAALRHAAHEWQCKFEEATSSNHQLRNQLDHLERSIAASNAIGNVTSQTVLTDITSRRPQSQGRTALKSSPVSASNLALLNAVEELRRKNISSEIQLDGIHQRGSCSITTVGDISNCNGAQHTPLSSNSSVGSRGVVEAVGASLANGCDALLEQLKRVEEELKRGCSAGDGFQGGDQSLESVIHEHREAVIALQRSVEDVVNHRHLAIESCESSVSTARTVEDFDKISGILTFEMERGSRLRSFIPTFSLLAMAVDRLQMVTLKPSE